MVLKPSPKPRTPRATSSSRISERCAAVPSTRNLLETPSVAQSLDGCLRLKGSLRFPAAKFRPPMYSGASRSRLPLPACGERVGVWGPIRWARNYSDVCNDVWNVAALSAKLRIVERPPHPPRFARATSPRAAGRGDSLYSELADSVLQLLTWPPLKPAENQRLRCSEVPWVKASGTT